MQGSPSIHDVVIVGAGPAGLTAAVYARRGLLSTLVLEKGIPGGQLNETDAVENWPGSVLVSGAKLMADLRDQAARLGAEIVQDEVVEVIARPGDHRVKTANAEFSARTVILAPGSRARNLSVPGAEEFKGRGVSVCATCDGYFFRDQRVIVVGAGDTALIEALFLARLAASVAIVVRHPQSDPRAVRGSAALRRRAEEDPKIRFLWNRNVTAVMGQTKVEALRLERLDDGTLDEIPCEGIFVSIGHEPQTDFLRGAVALDAEGRIETDDRLRASVGGVFAAGDARRTSHHYAQAVIAAADGAIAALEAESYLVWRLAGSL
ncbi:MAG: FAD-dependent oxidoreductase [Candidatus Bipolaricaulota bacterium]